MPDLCKVCLNSVKVILLYVSKLTPSADYSKVSQSIDYIRRLNSSVLQPRQALPKVFSAFDLDKRPNSDYIITLRFSLLAYYCTPEHFDLFRTLFIGFSKLKEQGYSALNMMTSVMDIAFLIFKAYKLYRNITKLKDQLLLLLEPEANVDDNFSRIKDILVDMAKFFYNHIEEFIRTESNPAILGASQVNNIAGLLRAVINVAGPWDAEPMPDDKKVLTSMQMISRLAFGAITSETKRRDLLNWAMGWYGHQLQIDFSRDSSQYPDPNAVGWQGIQYRLPGIWLI
jgi:hypothetical protein